MSTPQPQPQSQPQPPLQVQLTWTKVVGGAFTAVVTAFGLITASYTQGHTAGVSDGTAQSQAQFTQDQTTIADLRAKIASAATAASISQANESTAKDREGQWQGAYNTAIAANKSLAQENEILKSQVKDLEPCAYMENQITALETRISSATDFYRERQDLIDQRDRIQEQLSNCKK